MIAVETDLPAVHDVAAHTNEDATALKPVTVISGSSPGWPSRDRVCRYRSRRRRPATGGGWSCWWRARPCCWSWVCFPVLTAGDDDPTPPTATRPPVARPPTRWTHRPRPRRPP